MPDSVKESGFFQRLFMNKLENLGQFTGTLNYWRQPRHPFKYTDGVKFLAERGRAYWLLDAISSWQLESSIRRDESLAEYQFWTLTVRDDGSALLTCERDQDDIVIEQKIPFTDFPLKEIRLYLVGMNWYRDGGVLMLPSEY
jgi:hypothetical protein